MIPCEREDVVDCVEECELTYRFQDLNSNNNATAHTNQALNADQRRDCRKKSTRKSMAHLAGTMTPSTLDSPRTGLRRTLSRSSASERWVSEMGIESFLCCRAE